MKTFLFLLFFTALMALFGCKKQEPLGCNYHVMTTPKDSLNTYLVKYMDSNLVKLLPLTCVDCGEVFK